MTHQPYPRSLYRQRDDVGPEFEFDGVRCEMLTVESEDEEAAARKDGWHSSPAKAGAPAPAPAPAKKDSPPPVAKPAKKHKKKGK